MLLNGQKLECDLCPMICSTFGFAHPGHGPLLHPTRRCRSTARRRVISFRSGQNRSRHYCGLGRTGQTQANASRAVLQRRPPALATRLLGDGRGETVCKPRFLHSLRQLVLPCVLSDKLSEGQYLF